MLNNVCTTSQGKKDTAIVLNMLPLEVLFITILEKSKIDPGFCNFAFKAILATENREARMEVNDPMPNEQRYVLQQGLEAEKIKCNCYDRVFHESRLNAGKSS